ncbi:HNH endonuclease [bacterium]|nr:MAG: HNH endonuclease [bacterium]
MKVKIFAKIIKEADGRYLFPLTLGKGSRAKTINVAIPESYDSSQNEPLQVWPWPEGTGSGLWAYRNYIVSVDGGGPTSNENLLLRIKHAVLREDKIIARLRREIEAFENLEKISPARREQIPESVRLFVWQRDEGKCVKCGSRESLEFDHVISVALGGSNTERNIQLLCERCNREKGKNL